MKSSIKVFKFGGASVKDANGVKNVANILSKYKNEKIVIVISAMGKTTNALEEVVNAHAKKLGNAIELYEVVKQHHYAIVRDLFPEHHEIFNSVNDKFV